MTERGPRIPRFPRDSSGSGGWHEPDLKGALLSIEQIEQEGKLPNIEINLEQTVATLDGRRIEFGRAPLAWRFLVLLGKHPNEDLSLSTLAKMTKETAADEAGYKRLKNSIVGLRSKIEKNTHQPRILVTIRPNKPSIRCTYRLIANVAFIGSEEVEKPTQTFVFPDGLNISGLTKQEMEAAENIPFYPKEGIPRSKLATIVHGEGKLATVKQRLSQDISNLRKKIPPESKWNIVNVIPLSARRKGTEAVYCWKQEERLIPKRRSSDRLSIASQVPLDLPEVPRVDSHSDNNIEEAGQSLFTKEEIFVLANVLNDGNPEVFREHGFRINEDRKDIIFKTIKSLRREGIIILDPWLVKSEILPSFVSKLRSLNPDNIANVVDTYPILGLLIDISCDREKLTLFVETLESETDRLIQKYSSKR